MRRSVASLTLLALLACHDGGDGEPVVDAPSTDSDVTVSPDTDPAPDTDLRPPPNVLVVVMDDVGVDAVSTYGVQPSAPQTPTLGST